MPVVDPPPPVIWVCCCEYDPPSLRCQSCNARFHNECTAKMKKVTS